MVRCALCMPLACEVIVKHGLEVGWIEDESDLGCGGDGGCSHPMTRDACRLVSR